MNRREMFKALAAGAAALLGVKGLAAQREGYTAGTWSVPFTEERLSLAEVRGILGLPEAELSLGRSFTYDEAKALDPAALLKKLPVEFQARCTAVKIDGKWVNTSGWTPEQVAAIGPSVLKWSG